MHIDLRDHMGLAHWITRKHKRRFAKYLDEGEVFSCVLEGLHHAAQRFDPEKGFQFSSFGYKCALGYILSEFRRTVKARAPLIAIDPWMDAEALPPGADTPPPRGQYTDLYRALDRLDPRSRSITIGRYVEGREFGEMARIHGISKQRVHAILQVALKTLARAVEQGVYKGYVQQVVAQAS